MFAGIGGFRSGLSHYGDFFVPVGYCEIDPYAKRAYEAIYEPKGEIYFEDARGIVPESLPDIDLICGVISEFGEPNSVRVFQSLESEGALKMPEERCSLKSLGLPALKGLAFSSLKTFPDFFRMTGAGRLRPSSVHWMNWGMWSKKFRNFGWCGSGGKIPDLAPKMQKIKPKTIRFRLYLV